MSQKSLPKIQFLTKTKEQCIFDISYPEVFIANAIRRAIEVDVPTYGIDPKFTIVKNTSKFHNERLQHIISQIPINNALIENDSLTFKLTAKFDKTNVSTAKFSIIQSTPITSEMLISYETKADVKAETKAETKADVKGKAKAEKKSENKKKYVPDGILIVSLREGEQLEIPKINIRRGTCKENAIFKPCCAVGYKILENSSESSASRTVRMTVEPCCVIDDVAYPMEPIAIIKSAVMSIIGKFINLLDNFDKLIDVSIIKNSGEYQDLAIIKIKNEGHTAGTIIQGEIMLHNKSNGLKDFFCGYCIEHPLDPNLLIKMTAGTGDTAPDIILKNAFNRAILLFKQIIGQF